MPSPDHNPFSSFTLKGPASSLSKDAPPASSSKIPPSPSSSTTVESRISPALSPLEKRLLEQLAPLKRKHEAWKKGQGISPTIAEYKQISALAKQIIQAHKGEIPKGFDKVESTLSEHLQDLAQDLSLRLSTRFKDCGKAETFSITPPELPPNLTEAHLETINEVLGGGLEERILPTLDDLHNLDSTYVDVMYPATQSEADKAKGLTSYRPTWWNQEVKIVGSTFTAHRTLGEAYLNSMRLELEEIGGSLILLDTATKPNYKEGEQHYGSKEGIDPSKDPLLPLFKEAFGAEANRFKHSWKNLQEKLLPLVKKKIQAALTEKSLPSLDFEVILVPAVLDNLEMTLQHPESSTTKTIEWTSTSLKDDLGSASGRALLAGDSGVGGAAGVIVRGVSGSNGTWGVRLAVVLRATEH